MRILVENGSYDLQNLGDQAMLQVGLERLRGLWPGSELLVLTSAPERLQQLCADARPIAVEDRRHWMRESLLPQTLRRLSPAAFDFLERRETRLRFRRPCLWHRLLHWRCRLAGRVAPESLRFRDLVESADLAVALGGGYVNDSFRVQGSGVLTTLALAAGLGKPIAMFGQGLGPLVDSNQRALATLVFPRLSLLGLREAERSLPLAIELGARRDRITATGDDAVEPAFERRPDALGQHLGVNFRVTEYSGVTPALARSLAAALARFAGEKGGELVAVPIAVHPRRSDAHALQEVFPSLGAGLIPQLDRLTSLDAINRAGLCRVVVTGSYHAGVFALSQGVSVIGLVASDYYAAKFDGLRKQFGEGCYVFPLSPPDAERRLADTLKTAWDQAERARPQLLAAAEQQIAAGQQAYGRLKACFENPVASTPSPLNTEQHPSALPAREVSRG